jgi:hypothetical protein
VIWLPSWCAPSIRTSHPDKRSPSYFDLKKSGVLITLWVRAARDDDLDPLG